MDGWVGGQTDGRMDGLMNQHIWISVPQGAPEGGTDPHGPGPWGTLSVQDPLSGSR